MLCFAKTWILTPNSRYLIRLLSIIKIDRTQHKVSPVFRLNYSVGYQYFQSKKSACDIRSTEAIKWRDKHWCHMADITVESQSDWSCVRSEMCQQNIMEGLVLNDTSDIYRTTILV